MEEPPAEGILQYGTDPAFPPARLSGAGESIFLSDQTGRRFVPAVPGYVLASLWSVQNR